MQEESMNKEKTENKLKNAMKMISLLYSVTEKLGGKSDILCWIGSYGDTLDDEEIIDGVKKWLKE